MAKGKRSKHLEAFIQSIKDEWKGTFRSHPDLTILALQEDRVLDAIERRFESQAAITEVRQLDYDFYTGLHNLVFEFTPDQANLGARGSNAFLAILDCNGKLITLIDPFDPVQPNKFVPPLPDNGEQPFVLDRRSMSQEVTFSDEDMYPLQVRSHAFFQRIKAGGTAVTAGDVGYYSKCPYTTRTPNDYWTDYQTDECSLPPVIFT
ncbi:MAG: hypothetical protein ACREP6_04155 [Candidatus Binataceae bacterium]